MMTDAELLEAAVELATDPQWQESKRIAEAARKRLLSVFSPAMAREYIEARVEAQEEFMARKGAEWGNTERRIAEGFWLGPMKRALETGPDACLAWCLWLAEFNESTEDFDVPDPQRTRDYHARVAKEMGDEPESPAVPGWQ